MREYKVRFLIMRDVPTVALPDGTERSIPGKPGRVLRLLLLAQGQTLTKTDLAIDLGGIRPSSVESVVSRLRSTIGDQERTVVVAADVDARGGYRIDPAAADLDATAFAEVAGTPQVLAATSFESTDHTFGQLAQCLMSTWRSWHANPAPETSTFGFAEHAYHEFAAGYDRLSHALAYCVLRRWLASGLPRDLTDAVTFLNKLVAGADTDDETWALLLRAEGSQPNWQRRVPALLNRIERTRGELSAELQALHERILARDPAELLLPAETELVDIGTEKSIPAADISPLDEGNLLKLAQLVGLSSKGALRLENSRVEPRECIDQTVQRLWFQGIFASKWVTDAQVRNQFDTLLDRLDGDEDAEVHFLLLDPNSKSFDRFRAMTQTSESPESFTWLRTLSRRHRSFTVRLYDSLPTFRTIVIDDSLVTVAPYLNVPNEWLREEGWESPHLVLAPMAPFPLAKSFELMFKENWRVARKLENG